MYLCLCFAVTYKAVEELLQENQTLSIQDLQKTCRAGTSCGSCVEELKQLVQKGRGRGEEVKKLSFLDTEEDR